MLTAKEKRFIQYWEEQRTGGKWKYYLLYIIAGTFVASITLNFLYSMFYLGSGFDPMRIVIISILSFVLVTVFTIITWDRNENKFKSIIRREIREGELEDKSSGD